MSYNQGSASSYYNGAPQQGYPQQQYDQEGQQEGERGFLGAVAGGAAGAYGGNKIGGQMTGHSKTSTVIGAIAGAVAGSKLQDAAHDWREDHQHGHHGSPPPPQGGYPSGGGGYQSGGGGSYHSGGGSFHSGGGSYGSHSPEPRSRSINTEGNYSQSAEQVSLEPYGDYNLSAECRGLDGRFYRSTIALNHILANDYGNFRWSGGGGGGATMTIQPGDTLGAMAQRFQCPVDELARINNIPNPDMVYPGQVIRMPGRGSGGEANFGASARNVRLLDRGRVLEGELRRPDGSWAMSSIVLDERLSNNNGYLCVL